MIGSLPSEEPTKRMRVLIVNQHISETLGGSEMQCDLIARGLFQRGHEIIYAAVGRLDLPAPSMDSYGVIRLDLRSEETIDKCLEDTRPDVIYWRFNKRRLRRAVRCFRRHGIPFVFAVSSIDDLTPYAYRKRQTSGALDKARAYAGIARQALISRYNYGAIKHARILTSLNKSYLKYSPVADSVAIWNAVPEDVVPFTWPRPFICWVANIRANKRPEAFLRLAERLQNRTPTVDCLMIGDIKHKSYESEITKIRERVPTFHFLGPRSPAEVNGILQRAELLIHTCLPEGFGNNFIQAWRQGTPTVSLEFDPDGLIQAERMGYIAQGDEMKMADAVELLLTNHELRSEAGNRAAEFSNLNFTERKMIKELEKTLSRAVSGKYNS